MSTVPPSPAWATTRTSVRPLASQRGGHAGGHRRGVAEQGVQPGEPPRGLGVGGGEDLEAAGGVDGDEPAVAWRAWRRRGRSGRPSASPHPGRPGGPRSSELVRPASDWTVRSPSGRPAGCRRRSCPPGRSAPGWRSRRSRPSGGHRRRPTSRRTFSAGRPDRRAAAMRARSASTTLVVEVEKISGQVAPAASTRSGRSDAPRDRPAPEAGHHGVDRGAPGARGPGPRRPRARPRTPG